MENFNRPTTIGDQVLHQTFHIDFGILMFAVFLSLCILIKATHLVLHFWEILSKMRDVLERGLLATAAVAVRILVILMLLWPFFRPLLALEPTLTELSPGFSRDPYVRELLLTIALLVPKPKPLARSEYGSLLVLCLLYALGSIGGGGWIEGTLRVVALWIHYRTLAASLREGRRFDLQGGGDGW